jgi:hypothetical protein
MAEAVHERLRDNQRFAARNNRQPDASVLRALVVCGACGARMHIAYSGSATRTRYPQFRCTKHARLSGLGGGDTGKSCAHGNSVMAARLDVYVWEEVVRIFETPGALADELTAAHAEVQTQKADAEQPVDDLTRKIADAERRLANLRKMAELVESDDQVQAMATQITLLARDRDVWVRELAGREAAAARPRLREEAILDFERHVAEEHGASVETWAKHLMRQFLLLLDAWVEVWPLRDMLSGAAADRAVLHANLPLSGPRRIALRQLMQSERVAGAFASAAQRDTYEEGIGAYAAGAVGQGGVAYGPGPASSPVNCDDRSLTRSTT